MKNKKEIVLFLGYILISLGLYIFLPMEKYRETFEFINFVGLGILSAAVLILMIEDLSERMVKSGRIKEEHSADKSIYGVYAFFFGFSSLILSIGLYLVP
jgi:hypothetical protein